MLFRTAPSPTSYGLPFARIGGLQHQSRIAIAIISGTGKAANFQFCTHILSIDQNKTPLQISGKEAVC